MSDFFGERNPYGAFTNVSCPLIAESYIAFGLLGVALFAFVAGYVMQACDNAYGNYISNVGLAPARMVNQLIYFPLCALVFFIMRGDLLSQLRLYVGTDAGVFRCNLFVRYRGYGEARTYLSQPTINLNLQEARVVLATNYIPRYRIPVYAQFAERCSSFTVVHHGDPVHSNKFKESIYVPTRQLNLFVLGGDLRSPP